MNDGSIRDGASGPPWYGGHVGPLRSGVERAGLLGRAGGRSAQAWAESPPAHARTGACRWTAGKPNRLPGPDPNGPFRAARTHARIAGMQVLASTHAQAGRPTRRHVVTALGLGLALVAAAAALV